MAKKVIPVKEVTKQDLKDAKKSNEFVKEIYKKVVHDK